LGAENVTQFILAGDLGATKTLLALFKVKDDWHGPLIQHSIKEFTSREYSSLSKIVNEFISLSSNSVEIDSIKQATFGIAGPIVDGHSKLTNLSWELDEKELSKELGIDRVKLLNDLEADAFYVPFLKDGEKQVLYKEETPPKTRNIDKGTAAVIAPGTGLGEAFVTWEEGYFHAHASEGGHCDFAPTSEIQDGLLQYLRKKFGHASYELVCSGKGIYNTWTYFHESEAITHSSIESKISSVDDPTPIIVDEIMKRRRLGNGDDCKACTLTLDTFVSVLGAESGNLALKFFARNGVYIAGGLSKLLLPALTTSDSFVQAYLNKGRMRSLVSQFPVFLVLTYNSALLGAAHYTLDALVREQSSSSSEVERETQRVAKIQRQRR
jgi:glucokinase